MQITKIIETTIPMTSPTRKPLTPEALQRECDYHRSVKIFQTLLDKDLTTQGIP